MQLELLSALNRLRAARRAAVVVTDLDLGTQRLVADDAVPNDAMADALAERLRSGRSGVVEHEGRSLFLDVHVPQVRLVVVGAVHVSQALAVIAQAVGHDIVIIDPRTAFAAPERFPDCHVVAQWPGDALPAIGGLDRSTALIALTHDPKIDDPALEAALRSACFYIGALGSRKTHASRLARLADRGYGPSDTDRIHAPIGLDIGAVSPAEIAVSILAEVIASQRRKPPRVVGDGAAGSS